MTQISQCVQLRSAFVGQYWPTCVSALLLKMNTKFEFSQFGTFNTFQGILPLIIGLKIKLISVILYIVLGQFQLLTTVDTIYRVFSDITP